MEIGDDLDYISFLECLDRSRGKSHMHETKPDGIHVSSSPIDIKCKEIKPKRKRIRHNSSAKDVVVKESVGERARLKQDSVRSRKRRRENKEGLKRELFFHGSDCRTYDSDYFNYLRHMKVIETGIVVEIGGEVIVKYEQEVDTIHELEKQHNSFEERRENQVGKYVPVQERIEKDGFLEAEMSEKTVNKGTVLEGEEEDGEIGRMGISSSSFEKSAIQSEIVGFPEVRMKTDNRIEIKRQKIGEIARENINHSEEMEIGSCSSHRPEPVSSHLQGFMLLVKKLCPVETTIYPSFNANEDVIGPTGEPSTSKNLEKEPNQDEKRDTSSSSPRGFSGFDWIEEKREVPGKNIKLRCKGNRRGRIELEGLATFPDLSDSDEEPQINEIPENILCRPPSDYKYKLIEVLRRPFDKSEYRELINQATIRKRKIIYKELRSGERAMETDEKSKSFLDWYPEVKSKVERARRGSRMTLLRGLFFWLKNCCCEGSFKPWAKGYKRSKGAPQY